MTLLDPTQTDTEQITAKAPGAPREIRITVRAEFPNIVPAHDRYIVKEGYGSNLDRAIRDGWRNVFADPRLKGRKASKTMPIKATITL